MFVLASSSKCAVGFGGVSSSDFLSPPVSAHHLSGVCVCVCVCVCVRVGGRCTVLLLLGCQGGPDLPQPAVNPQMWRVGGFECYSISGRPPPPCFALWRCQAEAGGEGTGSQGMNSSSK